MLFVIDQQVGGPQALAADVEALVGGGHQLEHVRRGDDDLAHRIFEPERDRLVLGHGQGLGDCGLGGDLRRGDGRGQGRQRQGRGEGGAHGAARAGSLANHVRTLAQPLNRSDGTSIREELSPCTTSTPTPAGGPPTIIGARCSRRTGMATGPGRPVGPRSPWLTARTGCSSTAPVRRSARDIDPA